MAILDVNPVEQAFSECDISSAEMQEAVRMWNELYKEPYAGNEDCNYSPHMAVAATLVSKLDDAVFSEYTSSIEGEGQTPAAGILANLDHVASRCMQSAMVSGECLVKPIPSDTRKSFTFSVIPRENYSVLGRDEFGVITDVGTYETQTVGNRYYTLVERRTVDANGYLTIQNKLFESDMPEMLGSEIPLSKVEQFAMLEPVVTYTVPVHSIGLAQAKMPAVNMVDGSDDGVSVYAPSARTIRELNEHEAQYKIEFKNARSHIVCSEDYLRHDRRGNLVLEDDLFLALDEVPQSMPFTIYNPTIRDESFKRRENDLLRMIENQIGLKRGMLSDVDMQENTATEVNLSNGAYNLTVISLQKVWAQVVTQAFAICDALGHMYFGWNAAETPVLDFGDGVLYDRNKVFQEMYQLVTAGIMRPEVLVAWYQNIKWEPEDAEAMKAVQSFMPSMQNLEDVGRGAL